MICSKCGKENNKDSKFCNGCGSKFNNQPSTKTKTILTIIGTLFSVMLLVGIILVSLFVGAIGKGINTIKDKIDAYEEREQTRENIYDSIPKELLNRNLISKNLIFVDDEYGWGTEWTDKTNKYYFYIDNNIYDKYKSYWLEGIDKSQYRDKYNKGLATYGDYVFKAININDLSYKTDIEYGNVHLTANKTYYLVQIYDEAIYYKYITARNNGDKTNYYVYSNSNCKEESISKEYIFSLHDDKWEIEELIR